MIGVVFSLAALAVRINKHLLFYLQRQKLRFWLGSFTLIATDVNSPSSCCLLQLLGMVLSSLMIHQMRYPYRPTILMTVPAVFTTPPPKYQELHNPPEY